MFEFAGGLTWSGSELPMESPALFFPTPSTSEDSTTIMQSARQFTLALDSLKQVSELCWLHFKIYWHTLWYTYSLNSLGFRCLLRMCHGECLGLHCGGLLLHGFRLPSLVYCTKPILVTPSPCRRTLQRSVWLTWASTVLHYEQINVCNVKCIVL